MNPSAHQAEFDASCAAARFDTFVELIRGAADCADEDDAARVLLSCFGARLEHEAAAGEEAGDVGAFARRCWREAQARDKAQQAALLPLPVPPAPPARILPAEPGLHRPSQQFQF